MEIKKIKLIISTVIFVLIAFFMQLSIYATNENIEIVKGSETEYLIYIKDNIENDFQFAFSNDKNINPEKLTYINAANDSADSTANKIAYVDDATISMFDTDTYMWVKNDENFILSGIKIDLSDSILKNELEDIDNLTKTIDVDLTQTIQNEEVVDGVKITKKMGKVVLLGEGNYQYQLVKASVDEQYTNFMKLANKISKFNENTSYYTELETYKEFYNLFTNLRMNLEDESWLDVSNNEILQPEDAEDGEEYILWLQDTESGQIKSFDVQFLTCKKEVSEEKVIDTLTTKLPVTYDNNILLFVLGILIILAIIVAIRIVSLKNSEKSRNKNE